MVKLLKMYHFKSVEHNFLKQPRELKLTFKKKRFIFFFNDPYKRHLFLSFLSKLEGNINYNVHAYNVFPIYECFESTHSSFLIQREDILRLDWLCHVVFVRLQDNNLVRIF